MHINQRKEQFSRAYIHAVASVAGYALYEPYVDDDSIDCGLAARGAAGNFYSPRVELQLKSSSRNIVKKDRIVFPLGIKTYNDLRAERDRLLAFTDGRRNVLQALRILALSERDGGAEEFDINKRIPPARSTVHC
jgi:hypothetical protein